MPIEDAAKQRVLAAADELRPRPHDYVRELFAAEKTDALSSVQDHLVEFVLKAEAHIHKEVEAAMKNSEGEHAEAASGAAALQMVRSFQEAAEKSV